MLRNCVKITFKLDVHVFYNYSYRKTGNLANEPFERNWRILIWRLRRGYYSTDVASTGKL